MPSRSHAFARPTLWAALALTTSAGLVGCGTQTAGGPSSTDSPIATGSATTTGSPATSSSPPATTPEGQHSKTGTPAAPVPQHHRSAAKTLMKASGYLHPAVVRVGDHWEGATLGSGDRVIFWKSDGTSWDKVNASSHLPVFSPNAGKPSVDGALLPGADHATFLVTGAFTGNSTGSALSYGHADGGWSLITAQPDGSLAPSGHGIHRLGEHGLELNIVFTQKGLKTLSMWSPTSRAPNALQASEPTVRYWKASGNRLTMTGSNQVEAKHESVSPPRHVSVPPKADHLPDGTWAVRLLDFERRKPHDIAVGLRPQKAHACMSGSGLCFSPAGKAQSLRMGPQTDTTVLAHSPGTQLRHITAPGWAFALVEGDDSGKVQLSGVFTQGAPWVVSSDVATTAVPRDYALITVEDGRIVRADSLLAGAYQPK